jgi:putative ABC transport system permease protein
MLSDLRFAFRQLAKAPGFTAIIVLTLALSIGACTAIYSALDSIVLRPYDDPATERNVFLHSIKLPERIERGVSFPDFLDLEKQATSFEFMAQHRGGAVLLTGIGEPLEIQRRRATQRFFDLYGIKMALGRAFAPEEFVSGRDNVTVLTHALWQRAFGGAPDIIGRTLMINDRQYTVVGVSSERAERTGLPHLWLPRSSDINEDPSGRDPRGIRDFTQTTARLRSGVTIEQAQAELDGIAAALAKSYPITNKGYGLTVTTVPLQGVNIARVIRALFGAVLGLMLIACANVASLLLVRANARQREMSVRAALGASRGRLIRQLLTENCLVALIGGTAGTLLAQWALDFIRASIPSGSSGLNRLTYLGLDGGVLAFAFGLSLATALVFGLAPAWLSSSADLNEALKQGTRGSTEGRARGRFRATLVVLEVAMAVTLLASSGLVIRSFIRLMAYEPGFQTQGTAFVRFTLQSLNYSTTEQEGIFANALLARIRSTPGVEATGITTFFPLSGNFDPLAGFAVEGGATLSVADRPLTRVYYVSPDYFRTLEIPLKRGRFFSERDDAKAPRVAIINQTLARQHFPNQDPIGKRITIAFGPEGWREIVGVVGDVGHASLDEIQPAQLYEPHAQKITRPGHTVVVARGSSNASLLPGVIKAHVQALDPNLPVGQMSTVESFLHNKLTMQRLTLRLITAFSAIGLLIAAIGIYGVIAFSVSQRSVEIGIRMALGAQNPDVLRLVLRQGAWMIGIGFAVGIVTTFIAGRAIESDLYNTGAHDPVALVGVSLVFAAVAALACWIPARRATKVDPIVALRAE